MEQFFEREAVRRFEEMIEQNEERFFDVDVYDEIVAYYLEIGDYKYAALAIEKAQELYPNSIELKVRKLDLLIEKEDFSDAEPLIHELAELAKDDLEYLICCAKFYAALENSHKAIAYCREALTKGGEEAFLHNFMADEYQNLDETASALQHYKYALQEEPQDEYALECAIACFVDLEKEDEALQFLNDFLDRYPYSEPGWFEYANFYFERKKYARAIEGFDYLIAINPKAVAIYSHKAACYEALGLWKKAIEVYKDSQEYEFTKSYSNYKIGQCYSRLQQTDLAKESYQESIHEDPQFYPSLIALAEIYEAKEQVDEALNFYKEASIYCEHNLSLQKKMAYLFISKGKIHQALICLKYIVDLEENKPENWRAYIELLLAAQDYKTAIIKAKAALSLHPKAEFYYLLSVGYFMLNESSQALAALKKAALEDFNLLTEMLEKFPILEKAITDLGKSE